MQRADCRSVSRIKLPRARADCRFRFTISGQFKQSELYRKHGEPAPSFLKHTTIFNLSAVVLGFTTIDSDV